MTFALSHSVVRLCCSDSKKVRRREQLCTPCLKPTEYRAWDRRLRFCSSRLLARVFRSSSSSSMPLANCRACWVLVGVGRRATGERGRQRSQRWTPSEQQRNLSDLEKRGAETQREKEERDKSGQQRPSFYLK